MAVAAPRSAFRRLALLGSLLVLASGRRGIAVPQIGYAYPAGGARGTTFTVEVGGQSLRGADGVRVSGKGVRASVTEYVRALDNEELRDTERFLRNLVARRWCARVMDEEAKSAARPTLPDHPWLRDLDDMSPNETNQLRTRLFDPRKQPNAQIAEQVVLEVTIDPDAPLGDRELRVLTHDGLSNPLCFQVGALPEICENDFAGGPAGRVVEPPALLNGQIMPGESDRIRLRAKKGQNLVIRLQARRLIPYLADAVPGWFQAVMSLRDSKGDEVAWNDDYRFDPDPAIFYKVPADGVFELEIRDAIYRGRDDFVYRIAFGEFAFPAEVFPLGAQAGTMGQITVQGWNLPPRTLELDTDPSGPPFRQMLVGMGRGFCSEIRYAVDAWPEVVESEPNNTSSKPQRIAFPKTVNGRIECPGDVDVFRFDGRAGQTIVAETLARRLNSPLDSALRLVDEKGVEVALNDDYKDPEMGLITHQADSRMQVDLPHDGTYLLHLSDTQRQGGSAYAYRLRLRPAQPDFALRLVPSVLNVSGGRPAQLTVHVLRKDGFQGAVSLALVDAPDGFTLSNTEIPTDQEKVELKLTVPQGIPRQVLPLRVEGQAMIGDRQVRRPAVPAEDMMQAFLWRFLVPQQELLVAVTGSRPVPTVWRPLVSGIGLASTTSVRIPLGGTAQVRVRVPPVLPGSGGIKLASVRFRLANQPRGVTLHRTSKGSDGVVFTLKADRNIASQGDAANVIIEASTEPETEGGGMGGGRSRVSLGVLSAISFEVVQQ
ncbi:MAG: peptidase [Lentisphaeria bacterium]|nr:peptidase [Lentisphaeria bacterium]